jgi:hypothetical protein
MSADKVLIKAFEEFVGGPTSDDLTTLHVLLVEIGAMYPGDRAEALDAADKNAIRIAADVQALRAALAAHHETSSAPIADAEAEPKPKPARKRT